MAEVSGIANLLFSTEPKLRRMLGYWAATCIFYILCSILLMSAIEPGSAARHAGKILASIGIGGVLCFYCLVRVSTTLGISPWRLAFFQALFAIACNIVAYTITGPARGASLMVLLVVIVFCAFALRPRQTLILCLTAIFLLGAAMYGLVSKDPQHFPLHIETIHFGLASISLLSVSMLTGEMSRLRTRLKEQKEELLSAVGTIRTLATIDELTSLANRRHMHDMLSAEERRQNVLGQTLCIALLDIDFFKNVNDRYGHACGDEVLRSFAGVARAELRSNDVLARWGGEEFLLMLPDTQLSAAAQVLARMRERVGSMRIAGVAEELRISFSAGVVERAAQEPLDETINRADKAMYQAKTTGRDRIVTG
ncbi:MAG: diguanylate cyclase [Pseudomonadota bacterium]